MKQRAAVDDLAAAARAVLETSPDALSGALRERLADAVDRAQEALPYHVFSEAVEQAPVAISITDTAANILYVNPSFEQVTGYERSAVIGKNESLLSDKRTPLSVYQDLWQTLLAQKSWSGRLINRRKDGGRYLAEILIAPVFNEQGDIGHFLGIHRDVTDLHRLERQVANQKQLIETTLEIAPVVVALLDEAGNVALRNFAYRSLAEIVNVEPAAFLIAPLSPGDQDHGSAEYEVTVDTASGQRWFTCTTHWIQVQDDSADGFFVARTSGYRLLVAQDITRLKQQQEEVRCSALRALLAEEARVQGMREAIAAAEFQMQQPLNMLKAAAGILERRGESESNALRGVLCQAIAAGQEALERLRGSLPRERPESPRRLNLNQLARDVLAVNTERMLALGVQVEWRPAPTLPPVLGHENRVRAMLKQLLDNAIEAMDSSAITRRELRFTSTAASDAVRLVIEDTGPGIAEELRWKVFEPFFTTKKKDAHTGMGLAMVQEVINQHGGTLRLERAAEGGCRVDLQLPTGRRHAQL